MSSIYKHIKPDIETWPIYTFHKDKELFIKELNEFVFNRLKQNNHSFKDLLAKSIYLENQRVKLTPWKVDPPDEQNYWKELSVELNNIIKNTESEDALDTIMMRMINRYNTEIVGDFTPKTYRFARKFLTSLFKRLYNKFNDKKGDYDTIQFDVENEISEETIALIKKLEEKK